PTHSQHSDDTPTTDISTLSLHDALPICHLRASSASSSWPSDKNSLLLRLSAMVDRSWDTTVSHALSIASGFCRPWTNNSSNRGSDRKSTRLNSSHVKISYAVFCLKKKKE